MSTAGKIGLAAIAIGLIAAALPFLLDCTTLNNGPCGDGQALLIYPFLGLPVAALGFLLLLGNLIAKLINPTKSEVQNEEANF